MKTPCRVLAVDDSAAMLSIVSSYLRDSEFDVVGTARDGRQAVAKVEELDPDLLMLDLVMPGQGGMETLRQVRELRPETRVVVVSSIGSQDTVEECLSLGANAYLQKPFSKDDLIRLLRSVE